MGNLGSWKSGDLEKASTSGFDDLNGAIFKGEGRLRTGFFGLTGHQLVGAMYSNRQYTSVDQRLGFVFENRALAKQDGTWGVYYNFEQFLYETDKAAGHGVGLFGRFGASEGDPIPVQYFYSVGFGGKRLLPSRPLDQCGIGYYYSSINNAPVVYSVLSTRRVGLRSVLQYRPQPWLLLTPDVEIIGPSQKHPVTGHDRLGLPVLSQDSIGTAAVLGVRGQVIF